VAFYVPLGPRGLIFQLGTVLLRVVGGVAYWRASRRRALRPLPWPAPIVILTEP
jgi:hypothetical protein